MQEAELQERKPHNGSLEMLPPPGNPPRGCLRCPALWPSPPFSEYCQRSWLLHYPSEWLALW